MAIIFFHLSTSSLQLVFLVLLFGCTHLEFFQPASCLTDVKTIGGCIDVEREALLKFKSDLTDPSNRLSSWHAWDDCCVWAGVGCNNSTGHVVKLNLRNPVDDYDGSDTYENMMLGGKVNPSLVHLKHLNYLDLSFNNFNTSNIPAFIGSLSELKYLNLLGSNFHGNIPTHLGNLSKLQYLDLGGNYLKVDYNLEFLSSLSSLKYLYLRFVNLSKVSGDWLEHVNMLPSLIELKLSLCSLQQIPLSLSSLNFTSLEYLDLSDNDINSSMPRWLFNLTSLKTLDLSHNYGIHGPIPDSFGNMTSLQNMYVSYNELEGRIPRSMGTLCNLRNLHLSNTNINSPIIELVDSLSRCSTSKLETLDLSENKFNGKIPESLGKLTELKTLDLSANKFNGRIPESLGKLTELKTLDLSENKFNGRIPESLGKLTELVSLSLDSNFWEGTLSEAHFSNHTKLESLSLGSISNPFVINISSNWVCPFQLNEIAIINSTLGPQFPSWLRTQKNLYILTLSMVGISDVIPDWFTYSFPHLTYLDLSHNQIKGQVPLEFCNDLNAYKKANNSNRLQPLWQSKIEFLKFGSNLFSGSIPSDIGEIMPQMYYFDVSKNMITGGIPWSLCKLTSLLVLILSSNRVTGELPVGPECLNPFPGLSVVDLSNNSLSGKIPNYIGFLQLNSLKLSNNNFSGKLPFSLRNCTSLTFLDLGENHLTGGLPISMGYQYLKVLRLRSNMLVGNIPQELCSLSSLQLLDLSNNKLYGSIPSCLHNLSSMASFSSETFLTPLGSFRYGVDSGPVSVEGFADPSVIVLKGIELEYGKTLDLVRCIDLSSNKMSGEIPNELTKLLGLGLLNLSMNHFTGMIPENIGNLKQLELLDLSRNQLAGPIPPSMSTMTFLNHLNLSTNNLSGRIPTGFQLQTLNEPSIYGGNPQLCGPPLANNCSEKRTSPISIDDNGKEDESALLWLYISTGVGFAVGLWGFCGTLVFNKSWRVIYFSFLENIIDKIYVFIAVRIARWQRMG